MTRIGRLRLPLFLVMLFLSLPLFCQQQACPIQLQQIELTPRSNRQSSLGVGNFEMNLRVRYKNYSSKAVTSARILVETAYMVDGPTHQIAQKGRQSFFLNKALEPGQHAAVTFKVVSNGSAPRVWLTDVSFADGSGWSPSDQSNCAYQPGRGADVTGPTLLLPIPSKD